MTEQKVIGKARVNSSKLCRDCEESKVILYTTKKCARCKALKRWLRRNKLSFKEKNIGATEIMTDLVMRNIVVLSAPALELKNRVFLSDQIFDANNHLNPEFKKILKGETV